MCTTQRYTTSCSAARSESYVLLNVVVAIGESKLEGVEGFFFEPMFCLPSRSVASSENIAAGISRDCRATASYKLTECPTSRNLLAVSARRAIFCAKATRTIREASVIRWATFLNTYRGNIEASDGGNVDTASQENCKMSNKTNPDRSIHCICKGTTYLIIRMQVPIFQKRV
jgi:hypothetical protein